MHRTVQCIFVPWNPVSARGVLPQMQRQRVSRVLGSFGLLLMLRLVVEIFPLIVSTVQGLKARTVMNQVTFKGIWTMH